MQLYNFKNFAFFCGICDFVLRFKRNPMPFKIVEAINFFPIIDLKLRQLLLLARR